MRFETYCRFHWGQWNSCDWSNPAMLDCRGMVVVVLVVFGVVVVVVVVVVDHDDAMVVKAAVMDPWCCYIYIYRYILYSINIII